MTCLPSRELMVESSHNPSMYRIYGTLVTSAQAKSSNHQGFCHFSKFLTLLVKLPQSKSQTNQLAESEWKVPDVLSFLCLVLAGKNLTSATTRVSTRAESFPSSKRLYPHPLSPTILLQDTMFQLQRSSKRQEHSKSIPNASK